SGQTTSINGKLCVKDGTIDPGDICSTAFGLIVGDCDIAFPLPDNFDITQPIPDPQCGAGAISVGRDGWVSFTATANLTSVEYVGQSGIPTSDIALAIYRGACGTDLFLVDCINDASGLNLEQIKINTIVGQQYYIRIINTIDGNVDGRLCIYNTAERDVCDDNDILIRLVGDCNIPFDVPSSFDVGGLPGPEFRDISASLLPIPEFNGVFQDTTETACIPAEYTNTGRDAWIKVLGNGNDISIIYQNNEPASNPAIVVYAPLNAQGPVNCGVGLNGAGNPENQYACANEVKTASTQTESVSFQSRNGEQYLIRIIDLASGGPDGMKGTLCISDGTNEYDEPCEAREFEVGECSIPLNVISSTTKTDCFLKDDPGTCDDCTKGVGQEEGDSWAFFVRPTVCDPTQAPAPDGVAMTCPDKDGVPFTYWAGQDGTPNTPDDRCLCAQGTVVSQDAGLITIQYDNRDGSSSSTNADVSLMVYQDTGFDCSASPNPANLVLVGCSDNIPQEGLEEVQIASLDVSNGAGGERFYIRVINKEFGRTAFGKLCTFFGDNVADPSCPPTDDYGALEGEFRSFILPGGPAPAPGDNTQLPTSTIPDCVFPNGSIPKMHPDLPIRSQQWMRFFVDKDSEFDAITIQFDNTISPTRQNVAMAIYISPNNPNGASVNCQPYDSLSNSDGLMLIRESCVNTVFVGSETVTVPKDVLNSRFYYVRVMNVHNVDQPVDLQGRIRVFPFAACRVNEDEEGELVVDGRFADWPAIEDVLGTEAVNNPPALAQNVLIFDDAQGDDIHTLQQVEPDDPWPNDLDQDTFLKMPGGDTLRTGIARFATDYGYISDQSSLAQDTYNNLIQVQTELVPEGLYTVKQSPWSMKNDWYGYGLGYSGYGGKQGSGRPTQNYCLSGSGGSESEPCTEVVVDERIGLMSKGFIALRTAFLT
ncbi:MAG: hypothetical protein HC880_18910, partial [Bacteroidia bacterium]|nr:hypothetical protein [Bacteroidia bacterium]